MQLKPLAIASAFLLAVGLSVVAWVFIPQEGDPRNYTGIEGDANHGAYVARLAGCIACHTDFGGAGAFLAGGSTIKTPFGSFRAPNITPHSNDGIGDWTLEDFSAALTQGISPAGDPYYPVFPYAAYSKMTSQDIADLWAAMKLVPPVAGAKPAHDISFPFNVRFALHGWQNLFFGPGPFEKEPRQDDLWNRGAYIVNGPGHCVACHTPRNFLGARRMDRHLDGSTAGPDGEKVPSITAAQLRANGWTEGDFVWALRTGLKPDGDSLSGSMGEVVRHSTSWLADEDLKAIATYLMATE